MQLKNEPTMWIETFLQLQELNGQKAHEKMFNIYISKEMQIQNTRDTTSRSSVWLEKKKSDDNKYWPNMGKLESSYMADGNLKWCGHFEKTVWQFLTQLKSYYLTQVIYSWIHTQEKWKHVHTRNLHNKMFGNSQKMESQMLRLMNG